MDKKNKKKPDHTSCVGISFFSSPQRFFHASLTMYAGDERMQRKERRRTESPCALFLVSTYSV